jgi:lysophospholipase L1-like esterase
LERPHVDTSPRPAAAATGQHLRPAPTNHQLSPLAGKLSSALAKPLHSATAPPLGPSGVNFVIIGDSITAGVYGFPQNAPQGYPAVMQKLGMGQNGSLVYNLGMPSEKIGDMLGQYYGANGTTSVSTTVSTSSGSPTATLASANGVSVGMCIGAIGIPPNTTITDVSGTTVTLSNNATATTNAVACSIATPVVDVNNPDTYAGGVANNWTNFNGTAHQLSYAISGRPTYVFVLIGTNDINDFSSNTTTATTTAGSPNLTITSGNLTGFVNGMVVIGANLPTNPPLYIASGGGTANLVLSGNATCTGSFSAQVQNNTTPIETMEAEYTSLVAAAHADGDTIANCGGVIAMTILPRGNSTNIVPVMNNVVITEFNAWLRTGASGADYLFDTNSVMPPFGPATSNPYYFFDQTHLTDEGALFLGNYINQQFFAQVENYAGSSFSGWEGQYFTAGQLSDPSVTGPNANPGHDGVPNLLKYLYDLDPTATIGTADRAILPSVAITNSGGTDYLTLTFRRNGLAGGLNVLLQTSTDLATWTTVTPDLIATSLIPGTNDSTVQFGVQMTTATAEYLRLNVTSP